MDPVSRVLFWTCAETNSINITRMDDNEEDGDDVDHEDDFDADEEGIGEEGEGDSDAHFSILGGDDSDRPRSLAVHSGRGIVFFVNLASPIRDDIQ